MMRRQDFYYDLPDELIADYPCEQRSGSRLLSLEGSTGLISHQQFTDVLGLLNTGDVLVLNNTKVIPARLYAHKETGGKVEILIERLLEDNEALAHIKASKSPKPGAKLILENGDYFEVLDREDELFHIKSHKPLLPLLDKIGHIPLPPYIEREDTEQDESRYQTVYGQYAGAVAAPTAGLHFDEALLRAIENKGIELVYVTLHVGAGTFQPVRVDDIAEHHMHSEVIDMDAGACDVVNRAKAEGRRIVAVGTTSVRCLESVAAWSSPDAAGLEPFRGETDIFITPGYEFTVVDALITNFHLPESTLLMLVSAFAGYENIMAAYREAVAKQYRFFSYGDAMFLTKKA